jgi:DNA-binding NtrC family response regulator
MKAYCDQARGGYTLVIKWHVGCKMKIDVSVLVVDDEAIILRQAVKILDGEVFTAETVEDARKTLDQNPNIGVVICDEYLARGVSGSGLIEELSQWDRPFVFLLFTGGDITLNLVENAINNIHVFRFLKKPVEREPLRQDVRAAKLEFLKRK